MQTIIVENLKCRQMYMVQIPLKLYIQDWIYGTLLIIFNCPFCFVIRYTTDDDDTQQKFSFESRLKAYMFIIYEFRVDCPLRPRLPSTFHLPNHRLNCCLFGVVDCSWVQLISRFRLWQSSEYYKTSYLFCRRVALTPFVCVVAILRSEFKYLIYKAYSSRRRINYATKNLNNFYLERYIYSIVICVPNFHSRQRGANSIRVWVCVCVYLFQLCHHCTGFWTQMVLRPVACGNRIIHIRGGLYMRESSKPQWSPVCYSWCVYMYVKLQPSAKDNAVKIL